MAQACFDGSMADCDDLYWESSEWVSPKHPSVASYTEWANSWGGRVPGSIDQCVGRLTDS